MMFFGLEVLGKQKLLDETASIASLYGTVSLIVVGLVIQMARVYVHNKSEKTKFNVEKEAKKKKPAALNVIKPNNPYSVFAKIKNINDAIDELTILGKKELRKRLR
jgi:hypothetical protein